MGCSDSSKDDFELFSAKDIVDIIPSPQFVAVSTPRDRARLFEECRLLSVTWGGTFARTFHITGPRGDQLNPPAPTSTSAPPQPRTRKRKLETVPPPPAKKMVKYEGTLLQGGPGSDDKFELLIAMQVRKLIKLYEESEFGA